MTEQKHTPTPWHIYSNYNIQSDRRGIANCGGWTDNTKTDAGDAENQANAAFIVKAVNNHEKLVEILQRITYIQKRCDKYKANMNFTRLHLENDKYDTAILEAEALIKELETKE